MKPAQVKALQDAVRSMTASMALIRGLDADRGRLLAVNAELLNACKTVDHWLMEHMDDEDAENENFNPSFRAALKAVRTAIKSAEATP